MITLFKGGTRQLSKNFNERELFSKSKDAPDKHEFPQALLEALQYLRDLSGSPIYINSTYRTQANQDALRKGGNPYAVKHSPHTKMIAVDFQFLKDNKENVQKFHAFVEGRTYEFKEMRLMGVGGFGLYDNFIHLDTRDGVNHEPARLHDGIGRFQIWDKRT